MIEYYLEIGQREVARVLESKLPHYEAGSIPWFGFMMTYSLILIDDDDIQKAEDITQKAITHSKYEELPQDRSVEWDAIVTRIEAIKISKEN